MAVVRFKLVGRMKIWTNSVVLWFKLLGWTSEGAVNSVAIVVLLSGGGAVWNLWFLWPYLSGKGEYLSKSCEFGCILAVIGVQDTFDGMCGDCCMTIFKQLWHFWCVEQSMWLSVPWAVQLVAVAMEWWGCWWSNCVLFLSKFFVLMWVECRS